MEETTEAATTEETTTEEATTEGETTQEETTQETTTENPTTEETTPAPEITCQFAKIFSILIASILQINNSIFFYFMFDVNHFQPE